MAAAKAQNGETEMMDELPDRHADEKCEASLSASQRPRLKVSDILAGHREAILEHNGQEYLLRITANGRLILTK